MPARIGHGQVGEVLVDVEERRARERALRGRARGPGRGSPSSQRQSTNWYAHRRDRTGGLRDVARRGVQRAEDAAPALGRSRGRVRRGRGRRWSAGGASAYFWDSGPRRHDRRGRDDRRRRRRRPAAREARRRLEERPRPSALRRPLERRVRRPHVSSSARRRAGLHVDVAHMVEEAVAAEPLRRSRAPRAARPPRHAGRTCGPAPRRPLASARRRRSSPTSRASSTGLRGARASCRRRSRPGCGRPVASRARRQAAAARARDRERAPAARRRAHASTSRRAPSRRAGGRHAREALRHVHPRQPRDVHAAALQAPEAREDVPHRRRPSRASRRRRACTRSTTSR